MQQSRRLTGIIEHAGDGYVALCPELDIASQGDTLEGARANLNEDLREDPLESSVLFLPAEEAPR
jgi:hypothetical protein